MLPYHSFISWKLGPFTIQSFGLMMALGFLAAIYVLAKQFKSKEDKEHAYNLAIIAIVAGVLGARLLFFVENPGELTGIGAFFSFWDGGLSWFGGFFGGLLGCLSYIRTKGLGFWNIADKMAPALAIGHAFGRVGCILGDGGHVGKVTTMPWGFDVDGLGVGRHVTAWYELIGLLALFGVLMSIRKKKPYTGFVFHSYLIGYGLLRFVSDFFRTDITYSLGLTLAQYASIALMVVGVVMMAAGSRARNQKKR
jgi:phosphatidylglycerol---prolipoprotein diacylglyceryl transferase